MKYMIYLIAFTISCHLNAQNGWTKKTDFGGCGRGFGFAFVVNNKAYAGGGDAFCHNNETGGDTEVFVYSPDLNSWQIRKGIPILNSSSHHGFTLANYIFIFNRDTLLRYDPSTNDWKGMNKLPFPLKNSDYVTFSINNKAYLALGYQSNKVWEYDYTNDSWKSKKNSPFILEEGIVVESPGKAFIIGGGSSYATISNKMWEYVPSLDSWVSRANLPLKRSGFTGFHLNGKIYITTGFRDSFKYSNDMQCYDIATNTWKTLQPFPGKIRQEACGFSIGNKGYIVNGYDGSFFYNPYKELWEFDPEKLSLMPVQQYSFSIYPNPASGSVRIETDSPLPVNISITDATGKEIMSTTLYQSSHLIDISSLQNGIYFYKAKATSNGQIQYGKFIVGQ